MNRIELEERTSDRGKHLVDLLADGLGRPADDGAAHPAVPDDPYVRVAVILGGSSVALLFTGIVAVLLS